MPAHERDSDRLRRDRPPVCRWDKTRGEGYGMTELSPAPPFFYSPFVHQQPLLLQAVVQQVRVTVVAVGKMQVEEREVIVLAAGAPVL